MLSAYRLGDLVFIGLSETEKHELFSENPESIGAAYILKTRDIKEKLSFSERVDIISEIVLTYLEKYSEVLPKDIETSTVLHLRLGDAICGTTWHEEVKRPISIEDLEKKVPNDKIYVIGKSFFATTSSTNYDESICESSKYLNSVVDKFNATHFDGGFADVDLCCAIKAKCFVQGRGFFSKLIVDIRKKLNLKNVETLVHDLYKEEDFI